jgi:transcriptional regulator with XRE-family HTH domain
MKNRIEMLREMAKLKPVDVASAMGVGERTVVRWERGMNQIPDEQKLALAEFFEVSVSFLMGWDSREGNGNGNSQEQAA